LVDPDRGLVVLVDAQHHVLQTQDPEGQAEQQANGFRAVSMAPARHIANVDAELSRPVSIVDIL
jgi:hypothetical protein